MDNLSRLACCGKADAGISNFHKAGAYLPISDGRRQFEELSPD